MTEGEVWLVVIVTTLAVIACVVLHYEGLSWLSKLRFGKPGDRHRVLFMIFCILMLHIAEVWIFGMTYYFLLLEGNVGTLVGMEQVNVFDAVYFSATVFSTLGFGDIAPTGAIRFMTGTQSITGLTLITWSASFTFIEMQKIFEHRDDE